MICDDWTELEHLNMLTSGGGTVSGYSLLCLDIRLSSSRSAVLAKQIFFYNTTIIPAHVRVIGHLECQRIQSSANLERKFKLFNPKLDKGGKKILFLTELNC